jgi:hypothetical protein
MATDNTYGFNVSNDTICASSIAALLESTARVEA